MLLLPPSTFSTATKRCASANEKLWSPLQSNYSSGLDNALTYQAYLDGKEALHYWISNPSNTSHSCDAIAMNGSIRKRPCEDHLPTLCTNSGPLLSAGLSSPIPSLQVSVQSGQQRITGFRDFYTFQFRGIRFSEQPERFTFSKLYQQEGEVDATKYGPGCLQGPDPRWPELSEDCLFLNVWTPYLPSKTSKKSKLKAVMVWLYGGGNTAGTGTDYEKEGGNLASRGDVVVVTFNYRVGNLGFLAFNDGVHNGNYAISDMVTALQWVQKNIENFGGDPERVTIWGESAGAVNVRTLLAVPEAEGLFHGAIMQSTTGEVGSEAGAAEWSAPSTAYAQVTKKVLLESGCNGAEDEVACLRSYDALKWSTETGRTQAHFATRDDQLIFTPGVPLSGPLAHNHNIPVLLGVNRDEFSYYFTPSTTNFTSNLVTISAGLNVSLSRLTNTSYDPERSPSWPTLTEDEQKGAVFNATGRMVTDLFFTCLTHAFAYSATKNNVFTHAYEFEFNRTYQTARFSGDARPICGRDVKNPDQDEYYKCHAGEVPYTFGNILQQGWPDRDGKDTRFARLVVDYWSAFARTGKMEAEKGWLEARGFGESAQRMKEVGDWKGDGMEVRRLQWTGLGSVSIDDGSIGCEELGLGKDFYENFDYEAEAP